MISVREKLPEKLDELLGESKPVKDQPVMRTENLPDELAPDPAEKSEK